MSEIGSSTIKAIVGIEPSPFKSRSTVIFIACLCALLYINCLAWIAGFFSSEFALVSVYLIRDIMQNVIGHQKAAEEPNK